MSQNIGDKVWCPICMSYAKLIKVRSAAKLVDVSARTIYRYIQEGQVYTIKVAGKTYRVCSACLLRSNIDA
jgi:excisionase family DNA binding protein